MKIEISNGKLIEHVDRQLSMVFGDCDSVSPYLDETLSRVSKCFQPNRNKYFKDEAGEPYFSPYHSGQYAIFLYYLANTIHRARGNSSLATKVYYLNKILNSVDWYYEIELPDYWGIEHPLASVLGRAQYGNGFFFYQCCTVGGNKGKYPVMGENVILYSNVTVLGDTKIGNNVVISTGTTIKDEVIPDNCMVFGQSPNLIIKNKNKEYMDRIISGFWNNLNEQKRG
jgi:serine O-acetyltransferase